MTAAVNPSTHTDATIVAPQSVPELPADLDAGLRRLKLAAIRRTAPEVLLTANTQRWTPQEVLRTLIEAEIAARDASNIVTRLKIAGFPVAKTLESFDVSASSIQQNVFDYLSSLEWVRTQSNLAVIGPAGTGKSHTLIGLGIAAVHAGHRVRYFTATDLVETLYRGLADNTVGKIIESAAPTGGRSSGSIHHSRHADIASDAIAVPHVGELNLKYANLRYGPKVVAR
jgi:hypothetical protein